MGTLSALFVGLLFGAGLVVSGMVMPSKVLGFLDVTGAWDPSLGFVMGGALLVYAPLFRIILGRMGPYAAEAFELPTAKQLDGRLFVGAALFGVGWGLGGMCPGPALVGAGALLPEALVFVAAMVAGAFAFRVYDAWSVSRTSRAPSPRAPAPSIDA